MDINEAREHYLDYLENNLSDVERGNFEQVLARSEDIRLDFEDYKKIIVVEQKLAAEDFQIGGDFSAQVMEKIEMEKSHNQWRLAVFMSKLSSKVLIPAATAAVVCVSIMLVNSDLMEQSMMPVGREKVEAPPVITVVEKEKESGPTEIKAPIEVKIQNQGQEVHGDDKKPGSSDSDKREIKAPIEAKIHKGQEVRVDDKKPGSSDSDKQKIVKLATGQSTAALPNKAGLEDRKSQEQKVKVDLSRSYKEESPSRKSYYRADYANVSDQYEVDMRHKSYVKFPPYSQQKESYGQYEENKRFSAALEPVSTFSLDVDTGSYTNARRYLAMGQLPPKDSVRVEEFINYFEYNYKKQTEEPFSVQYELAPSPLEPDRFLLKLGVRAKDVKEEQNKLWNLVFLVDTSGSMDEPNKLPLLKQSIKVLVNKMRSADRVAIVTYAGSAGVALESTAGNEKQKINAAIDNMSAGGGTHGSAGIDLAYQIALQNKKEGVVNRVILATDGDFNVGTYDFDGLKKLIEEKRNSGITLTTLGFGAGNYNEKTLEQLANKGNGNYFYIDSFQEARKVMDTQLVSNMEVVAKDVKVQMEFNPDQVSQYRLIGYDNRRLNREDFVNDKIDAGEIGSGHTVTVVYEIILKGSELAKKLDTELRYQVSLPKEEAKPSGQHLGELGYVKIRYKQPESDVSTPLEFPVLMENKLTSADQASDDFKFAAAVVYFGEILRESQYRGNYKIDEIIKLARKSIGNDTLGYRQEFVRLLENAAILIK